MRTLAAAAVLSLLFACQSPPPEMTETQMAQHEEEVLQAITQRTDAYEAIATSGDLDGWWSYWTPDARAMEPGMDLSGMAFHDMARDFWEAGGRVISAEWKTDELFVHGDVAYQIGEIHEAFQYAGEEPGEARNHIFVRWERQPDGVWKIDRFLASPVDAPAGGS